MRVVLQRVLNAKCTVDGEVTGEIGKGYLLFLGIKESDTSYIASQMVEKIKNLRIFEDENGKMNKSILDVDGEILCISQFTLAADTKKGNRPSFINAMEPVTASKYYDLYCDALKANGVKSVETGEFGADMQVTLTNDGPVTIILDTDVWNKKG